MVMQRDITLKYKWEPSSVEDYQNVLRDNLKSVP